MNELWTWDPTLFDGAAAYYERGRLPYAPRLAETMAEALALDGTGRLLDVGCGPGTIALRLAHLFDEVVGLDADPDMLIEGQRLARRHNVANVHWVAMRAEALPAGLGRFRVVTFAASLHWMDRPRVFATVRAMLDPGGAVVHVDNPGYRQDALASEGQRYPAPPEAQIVDLRKSYLGPDRRAGQGIRNASPDDEDDVFRATRFIGPERVVVPDRRVLVRSVDDIVAEKFSSSGTAPHLFGERLPAFEADLRTLLLNASPKGLFSVNLSDNELKVWRPGTTPAAEP